MLGLQTPTERSPECGVRRELAAHTRVLSPSLVGKRNGAAAGEGSLVVLLNQS